MQKLFYFCPVTMKLQFIYRFISLKMAFLILFSSVGLGLNAHYCNQLHTIETSILPFSKSIDCEHEAIQSCCVPAMAEESLAKDEDCGNPEHQDAHLHNTSCCEDFYAYINLDADVDVPQQQNQSSFDKFLFPLILLFQQFAESLDVEQLIFNAVDVEKPLMNGQDIIIAFKRLKISCHLL